jgi:glycosyltransferase involved in cell wall biosynthesis
MDTDDKKKALLIRMGPYDMTQAIPRAAATLQEMGYDITILSMDIHNNKSDEEEVNGWKILWYHHQYKSGDKLSFLWAWLCWWIWVIRHIRKGKYDLVQASNLESIVPCVLAKYAKNFPLVLDVRDPWGMVGSNSKSLMMQFFKGLECWAAARVDGIVLSQGLVDRIGIYFGKKVRRNIPVVQVLNVPGKDMADDYCPPNLDQIRVNFSGHISYVRNAQAFIDLAKSKPEVQIDIIGEARDLKLKEALKSLSNVKIYGRVSFDEAMKLLSQANIIAVTYDSSTELAIVSSANKMFEAMMMSRPYLGSKGAYPGLIAEKYDAGWAIPYGDSQALINLVSDLQENPKQIEEKAKNGRKAYVEHFTWEKQKANLVTIYKYVAGDSQESFQEISGWKKVLGSFQRI